MNFQKIIILTILLGLIVPAAGAAGPDRIALSSDTDWLVANGTDFAGITVRVLDGGGAPLPNCTVALSVDPAYGRLAPATVTTGPSGTAATRFITNTTSGVAVITARAGTLEETLSLSIDHDLPSRFTYLHYDGELTAGNTTTITLGLTDRHGNPVDDRRVTETVRFSVGSVDDDAVFIDDGGSPVPELERSVNVTGFVQAELRTGRTIGENIVRMTVLPAGVDRYISIRGLPTGLPAAIEVSVSPDADPIPYRSANGVETFTLTYRLFDAWGNPAAGRGLQVNTSLGEGVVLTTNGTGIACLTYGPKETTGRITITATAVENASVIASETVEFIHTDPVDMLLSANPQSMPSRDVDRDSVSELRAKVIDEKGNPVQGEDVTFSIRNIDVSDFVQTRAPVLAETSAKTDANGYASVRFYPGAFTTDRKDPKWSGSARGGCEVVATWNGATRTIPVTWENYPYLSVEAEVVNETVAVNDTIDVTVRLRGDGWALQPDPIDVVLVVDRSKSMDTRDKGETKTRMAAAKAAARSFVGEMNPARDKIGLVSYSTDASCDLSLAYDYSKVNSTIDGLRTVLYTATRKALYVAIQEMAANKNSDPDAVQAVILLSDGEYNYYGDPLARGTGRSKYDWSTPQNDYTNFSNLRDQQSMAAYAMNNGIRLYMISFSGDITENSPTWKTMDTLAGATGGKHYHAATGDDLAAIYAEIAGVLKAEAGVDTTMTLDFGTIRVNDEDREGNDTFAYIHENGVSTVIASWVENETGNHTIIHPQTINQTNDWNDDQNLNFDIGTVHLDQTWEATFRLRVLTDGNINVFGPGSRIRFNDGAELALPDTFITAVPDLTNTGLGSETLTLANPRYTCAEPVLELLTGAWDLTYTGSGTVTQIVEYSNDGGLSWVQFDTPTGGVTSLYVRDLPRGEYLIRVRASADDAPDAGTIFPPIQVGERQNAYIRLA
ncbi:Ig-like domain-containing protein [Methanoculleus sp.]|uniref:Ig-like domain-containing protein n=1 Tax=Methanoculleus sp. TaxID=90427 RepID=UPI002FC9D08F